MTRRAAVVLQQQAGRGVLVPRRPLLTEWYTAVGNFGGLFADTPRGVVLHGSRSGNIYNDEADEWRGTVNYVARGTNGVTGWNATIGGRRISLHIGPGGWGWHARSASPFYLSAEFAQPYEGFPVSDESAETFAWWFLTVARDRWPDLPAHFPTHAEVEASGETVVRDGKTDPWRYGDPAADEFRARLARWIT